MKLIDPTLEMIELALSVVLPDGITGQKQELRKKTIGDALDSFRKIEEQSRLAGDVLNLDPARLKELANVPKEKIPELQDRLAYLTSLHWTLHSDAWNEELLSQDYKTFKCELSCKGTLRQWHVSGGDITKGVKKLVIFGEAPGKSNNAEEYKVPDRAWHYGVSTELLKDAIFRIGRITTSFFTDLVACPFIENKFDPEIAKICSKEHLMNQLSLLGDDIFGVVILGKKTEEASSNLGVIEFLENRGVPYKRVNHPTHYIYKLPNNIEDRRKQIESEWDVVESAFVHFWNK